MPMITDKDAQGFGVIYRQSDVVPAGWMSVSDKAEQGRKHIRCPVYLSNFLLRADIVTACTMLPSPPSIAAGILLNV
jgi:hypothetical protein